MREIFRRGILVLVLITVLSGAGCAGTRADDRRALLEAYLDSPIPKEKYDLIEEVVAAEITEALRAEEITPTSPIIVALIKGYGSEVSFTPPVVFEIETPPPALFASPREKILLTEAILLERTLSPAEMEEIEDSYLAERNLSAYIITCGLANTNPPTIPPGDLRWIILAAGHEWTHHYLTQYHFGGESSPELAMVNECTANAVGSEVREEIWAKYHWGVTSDPLESECRNYSRVLRESRRKVDFLLSKGEIEEAEAYMEDQRLLLCKEECCPRKLNQAFFAIYEQYGVGAEGDNPIPQTVEELRAQYPTLGEFLEEIRKIHSYEDFLVLCESKGIDLP